MSRSENREFSITRDDSESLLYKDIGRASYQLIGLGLFAVPQNSKTGVRPFCTLLTEIFLNQI